jgi:RNA polymerase sigma factor (sigma-70 family)
MNSTKIEKDAKSDIEEFELQVLVDSHDQFLCFLTKHVENKSTAEDLLQDAMERAIKHQDELSSKDSVITWFYRVMRNVLVDHYRSKSAQQRKKSSFLEELTHLGDNLEPPNDGLKTEICACFKRLLPTIKPEYAELIERVDLNNESPEKIAKDLNITSNNLTVRLHRARQALKQKLKLSCGTCTTHGCLDCTCN